MSRRCWRQSDRNRCGSEGHDCVERVPVSSVYLGLYDGPHATPPPATEGPVFLGIDNIMEDGHLDLSGIRHIAEDDFGHWTRRVQPRPGDIVFTYEATLNRYAIIPIDFRGCLGRRLALIRPNLDIVDTRYLFYYFFGSEWRSTVARNTLIGSTVDRIPLTKFPNFEIALPPLPTQRKIAAILSAYDDLIENNTRRIAILEQMAQALYREWFVEFRFPGHAQARIVDSPLGAIPDGWEVVPIGAACSGLYDGPHATPLPSDDGPVFLGIKNITEDGRLDVSDIRHISEDDFVDWTKRVVPCPKDIVFTYEAALHRYAMIPKGLRCCLGRRVALIRPNPLVAYPSYLFRYLLSEGWHKTVSQHVILESVMDLY
jgi:type I restriction enzyme, S subunit